MTGETSLSAGEVNRFYEKLKREAESGGYHLNPDAEFAREIARGLLTNEKRYGYQSCPCRLSSGEKQEDIDIICPCDYRDADVSEYDACYCGLYVSQAVVDGHTKAGAIPERRPPAEKRKRRKAKTTKSGVSVFSHPVWRCSVCGYLCARESPPEVCPICKAKKERFERFI
jgi:ferredoxin-thioredoxin reductase catalytic subunit